MSVLDETESKYNILDKVAHADIRIKVKKGNLSTTLFLFDNQSFFYTLDNGSPRMGVMPMNLTRRTNEKFDELLAKCLDDCYKGLFEEGWETSNVENRLDSLAKDMTAWLRETIGDGTLILNNGTLIESVKLGTFAKNVSCGVLYSDI